MHKCSFSKPAWLSWVQPKLAVLRILSLPEVWKCWYNQRNTAETQITSFLSMTLVRLERIHLSYHHSKWFYPKICLPSCCKIQQRKEIMENTKALCVLRAFKLKIPPGIRRNFHSSWLCKGTKYARLHNSSYEEDFPVWRHRSVLFISQLKRPESGLRGWFLGGWVLALCNLGGFLGAESNP